MFVMVSSVIQTIDNNPINNLSNGQAKMFYALICNDKPDSAQIRANNRQKHLDYLDSLGNQVKAAGPFVNDEDIPTGSLIIVEAESEKDARNISDNDPYTRSNLFESVDIRPWKWLIKNPGN